MQIVPLPPLRSGEYEHTPFIIVLDQLGDGSFPISHEYVDDLRQVTGAATVVLSDAVLDAPAVELTDEQRAALLARLGVAEGPSGGGG